jgi:hypothetical protein
MQFKQSAAVDGPQQTGTTRMRERSGPMAAEQGRSIPAQLSRAPSPIFIPGQEIVAVAQKLAPSVQWDVGEWAMVFEARDPVDPTGRNAGVLAHRPVLLLDQELPHRCPR